MSAFPARQLRFLRNLQRDMAMADGTGLERELSPGDVVSAFSRETGLPLWILDDRVPFDPAAAEQWFSSRVIGQTEAVSLTVGLLTTLKAQLNREHRPLASLLLIGPTGVGKTELAKSLAEYMFGAADAADTRLVRIDMSEYADRLAAERLIGGSASAEGILTSRVREQPFSVILLDEFEKADPAIFDLLLQVLGEGRLTDAAGRVADFRNAIMLMTSNLGAASFGKGTAGFSASMADVEDARRHFEREVRQFVRPELFNRIDRIVPFGPLDCATARRVVERQLQLVQLREGLRYRNISLRYDDNVVDYLLERGFETRYGARSLKRVIERELLAPLAEELNQYAIDTVLVAECCVVSTETAAGVPDAVRDRRLQHTVSAATDAAGRVLSNAAAANTDLFQAGVTSQSTISAAALLKTIMMNRTVRVCGELTPQEFRVLQEQERAFADQFHVIRVEELAGDANLRVLLGLQRQLELRYGVRFQLETLPAIIDLQRRYVRDAAFPGKAAGLMKRLAAKFGAESEDASFERRRTVPISQESVFEFFRQQSGLPLSFLDQRTRLERGQIVSALRERFVGQPQAVNAAVEIISIARARLNDTSRPLATLLLLGPTGVGKTEFARSLAGCLFGSAERLLRFDMNEFVSPTAVPLLAGTFSQPDGLLTAAVRRQPFAVLLFDEIEKAHPNVFDLLLQVLGEGRLTDARGRTTDFSNTLILLTSNLGTQRSESSLGFGGGSEAVGHLAIRAAERFFRPEFFNRIDRVIPFERLSRADVQGISPVRGARALKRVIERELAQPVSTLLADFPRVADEADETAQAALSLIEVEQGPSGLLMSLRRLRYRDDQQPRSGESGDGDQQMLAEIERILHEVEGCLPELRTTGVFDTSSLTPAQTRYLLVQEELRSLRELYEELTAADADAAHRPSHAPAMSRRGRGRRAQSRRRSGRPDFRDLIAEVKIDEEIDEVFQTHESGGWQALPDLQHPDVLLARCCRLRKLAFCDVARMDESVTLQVTVLDADRIACLRTWSQWFVKGWVGTVPGAGWGLSVSVHESTVNGASIELRLQGVLACDVADCERGFQLLEIQGQPSPTLIRISGPDQPPPDVVVRQLRISSDLTRILSPGVEELYLQTWRLQPD